MLSSFAPFLLFGTALLLGLRHGIDWDHIAAISDITTSSPNKKLSFIYGTLYVLGHALVIIILGLSAVILGIKLPDWVDSIMEPVVGITLIFLGLYLAFSIFRYGKNIRLRSRWMLIFSSINKVYNFIDQKLTHRHTHSHFQYPENFGVKTSLMVGVIHGIGAETPTQLLLFTTAAGVGGSFLGLMLVFTFVLGLILSNTLIIILSILGFAKVKENSSLYLFLAGVTAFFSLTVGILFLLGKAGTLPALLGG